MVESKREKPNQLMLCTEVIVVLMGEVKGTHGYGE
jgi:hypothetical protein